jgi:hypothetical protein
VFTQTTCDEEGFALRDPGSTTYVGAIETAQEFGLRLYLEGCKRGWNRAEKKVVIGDGAEWIWNIAEQHFPGAIQIVDLYHARQHLWDLARKLFRNQEAEQERWMVVHKDALLDEGKIEDLVASLRSIISSNPELSEKIRIEADYFEKNTERMRYPEFRAQHLFVGSGVIEAGCQTVIGSRLNSPACSGRSAEPTPSLPCDAATSTTASRTTGRRAVRRLDLHFYVAHPCRAWDRRSVYVVCQPAEL